MIIESFSLAPGASVTVPLIGVTGQLGQIRSPYPSPDARIEPDDGSVFTAELVGTAVKLTGVAEGEGFIRLVSGNNVVSYKVTVEKESPSDRWNFAYNSFDTTYVPPPEPLAMEVLVNDQRVQLTFTGTGADEPKDIDWGDGTVWQQRDDNPAQYDYTANGTYTITVGNTEVLTATVTIDHFPIIQYNTADDPIVELIHDKGDISTTVDWGDGTVDTELADAFAHMYATNGTFTITTTIGGFPPQSLDVTIANAELGGASVPPMDTICYGPFNLPGLQQFWVCTADSEPGWFSVAIDIDGEPGPDLQVFGAQLAEALKGFDNESVVAALRKIIEVWKG